jgi:hypothetical protein
VKTLSPHYPSDSENGPPLTATQLISLHLFLHRPGSGAEDPLFGPYISILPREFNNHPLAWRIMRDCFGKKASVETHLLDSLPPSAERSLSKVNQRFWEDWRAVLNYIVSFLLIRYSFLTQPQRENPNVLKRSHHNQVTNAFVQGNEHSVVMDFVWAWLNGSLVWFFMLGHV